MERKKQIRQEYRTKRNLLTEVQVQEWSGEICRRLMRWELFLQSETIFFYYPLKNEANLLAAAGEALRLGKCVGFPKTEGENIRFYQVDTLSDFAEGCFHVMEPVGTKPIERHRAGGHPLILTPGLAFDEAKNRMGYGKGYYDRYAAGFPGAVKAGIAYEMQIANLVPTDDYDVPMDYLVTEQRIF